MITAAGGSNAAGIGSGSSCSCGVITITGGTVAATGGIFAAGIGSGGIEKTGNNTGTGKNIGGSDSPESYYATANVCESITITDGVTSVTATKGEGAPNSIGAGFNGICGIVTIGGRSGAIEESPYTYRPNA